MSSADNRVKKRNKVRRIGSKKISIWEVLQGMNAFDKIFTLNYTEFWDRMGEHVVIYQEINDTYNINHSGYLACQG